MNLPSFCYRIFIAFLFLGVLLGDVGPVHSAARYGWETPQYIPGLVYAGQKPYFVVDPMGKLHVFHSQQVDDRVVILYSHWVVEVGWLAPVDIIVSDVGQARITGAFVDDTGMMNLIFWGGDIYDANIFFTRAPLADLRRSNSWSEPRLIGSDAIFPVTAAIASDQHGYMVVVYSNNREGRSRNGLCSIISYDYGDTWTKPSEVFLTASNVLMPLRLDMIIAQDGSVHAIWAEIGDDGIGLSIYYASLTAGESQWDSPTILAERFNYEAHHPRITEYKNFLIAIFNNDFPTTRQMRVSYDNGETWSMPIRMFEQVGANGPVAFVVDSSNSLHMFFGNRIDTSSTHGVWHSVWEGSGWGIPSPVISGVKIFDRAYNNELFDPTHTSAVICHGNVLFIAWRNDPSGGGNHIWYTYQYLDTLPLPTMVVRTPTAGVAETPENEALVSDMASMQEDIKRNVEEVDSLLTAELLVYSLLPAMLLIGVLVLWRLNRH